jgi:ABC-type glycerol-3-phosphate transport system permease component
MTGVPLMVPQRPRQSVIRRGTRGGLRTFAIALAVIFAVVPFLYVVSVSFRQSYTLYSYPPHWIPNPLSFVNYRSVFDAYPLLRWMLNTIGVAAAVCVIKVVMDSMAAYAFSRMEFRGRSTVSALMLCAILVPPAILIIPLFFMVRDLGIFNTYWALILPPLASPLGVFMLRAFIRAVPPDLEHAARVDGCNSLQIYWRVILPLIRPGLVVVAIYVFVLQYSSFVWPLVGTQSPSLYMISVGLSTMNPENGIPTVPVGYIASASVITTLVMTGLFIAFQRQFVGASLLGALKE